VGWVEVCCIVQLIIRRGYIAKASRKKQLYMKNKMVTARPPKVIMIEERKVRSITPRFDPPKLKFQYVLGSCLTVTVGYSAEVI